MKNTFLFKQGVYIAAASSVAGPKEAAGPLGRDFDKTYPSIQSAGKSWEETEIKMQQDALDLLLLKSQRKASSVEVLLGGDLINQLTITNFATKERDIPFLGLYNACATMAEGMLLAASLIGGGFLTNGVVVASSHNAASERQYRYPNELGVQREEYSQCTVTAAGAMLLSKEPSPLRILSGTVGTIVDYGVKDPSDMGAAMAPAAFRTIREHLRNSNRSIEDYDLICTGDLGLHGHRILTELMKEEYRFDEEILQDSGMWIYKKNQDVFCGGSGAGCSAAVWSAYVLPALKAGKYRRVLLLGTGALHSPVSVGQGNSIPAIAHGLELIREEG